MGLQAQQIIDEIILREGDAYTNNPADRGGPTKYGITQATLSAYFGSRQATVEDVQNLTRDQAVEIYQKLYIAPFFPLGQITPRLLGLLVDSGVQHGTSRAVKWLQTAIGAQADGILGPGSLQNWQPYAVGTRDQNEVYRATLIRRIKFYADITAGNLTDADKDGIPDNLEMLRGWINRICEFV
jgi:lysozyme family protein